MLKIRLDFKGLLLRDSMVAVCCVLEQETLFSASQPRKTEKCPDMTEKLFNGM